MIAARFPRLILYGLTFLVLAATGISAAVPAAPGVSAGVMLTASQTLIPQADGTTRLQLPFVVSNVSVAAGANAQAVFAGLPLAGLPGHPALPVDTVRVLLPPDARESSIVVSVEEAQVETEAGDWDVMPAPPLGGLYGAQWPPNVTIVDGRVVNVYAGDAYYPQGHTGDVQAGRWRQWKLVTVPVFPYRYNPVTRQLARLNGGTLVVRFASDPGAQALVERSATVASQFMGTWRRNALSTSVLNFGEAVPVYDAAAAAAGPGMSSGVADYVIVTTAALQGQSGNLAAFVAYKQALGFTVRVITESGAEDDQHYLTGATADARANNIRNWLAARYASLGIQYVLLVGDPRPSSFNTDASIPMKMCYPRNAETSYKDSPTDLYYADLTGNWDNNANGVYGEYADMGAGGLDLLCEVAVGRIPVYDTGATQVGCLDSILGKTVAYESSTNRAWRSSYLGAAGFQDDGYVCDGAKMIEEFCGNVLSPNGWSTRRLYQQGSRSASCDSAYASDYELRGTAYGGDVNHLSYHWQANDYGVVMWWGHGASTWTQVGPNNAADGVLFSGSLATALDDTHPSFLFPNSCNNGYPETTDNLCVSALQNGAIAALSPSRVSWYAVAAWSAGFMATYSDNASYNYSAAKRLVVDQEPIGTALTWVHANGGLGWQGSSLMNHMDFNLYGDPAVGLASGGTPSGSTNLLAVTPVLLTNAILRGVNAASQTFTVRNAGSADALNYSIADNVSWLTCSPTSGVTLGEADTITVIYSTTNLAAGTYAATVTVTSAEAENSPCTLAVTLSVTNAQLTPPVVSNPGGASNVTATSAMITGYLSSTGQAPTYVRFYWGMTNGVTNTTAWATSTVSIGPRSAGVFITNLTALVSNRVYYYRAFASNVVGSAWASNSVVFTTTGPPLTHYVSASNATPASPYTNWTMAAKTIQAAVGIASNGATVCVGNGTYMLTGVITVARSVLIRSVNGATVTTVDGQNMTNCFNITSPGATLDGFTITRGRGGNGGGIQTAGTLINCIIVSNTALYRGGGVYLWGGSNVVSHCVIRDNYAGIEGGGVACATPFTLRNCLIASNMASNRGGGLSTTAPGVRVQNCTIVDNSATNSAGGIYFMPNCSATNTIVMGNHAPIQANCSTSGVWGFTCSEPLLAGVSNTSLDPQFVNAAAGDYRLTASSPCVDRGTNATWTTNVVDLDGNPRIWNGRVDLGAYELIPYPPARGLLLSVLPRAAGGGAAYALPYAADFETLPVGSSLFDTNASPGWYGSEDAVAIVTNIDYARLLQIPLVTYPLTASAHTRAVVFSGGAVSNVVADNAAPIVSFDVMLQPVPMQTPPLAASISNSPMSLFVDTNGFINVYHAALTNEGDFGSLDRRWTVLDGFPPIGTDKWVRVTVTLDFSDYAGAGLGLFQLRVNGHLFTDAAAFATLDPFVRGGSWFVCANNADLGFGGVVFSGSGMFDDVVMTNGEVCVEFVEPVGATVFAIAYGNGTISPSGIIVFPTTPAGTNFVMTAQPYYHISQILINNVQVVGLTGTETNYNLIVSDIMSSSTVDVYFAPDMVNSRTPVWWLAEHGLSLSDDTTDVDHDGSLEWQEYLAGTNPTDPQSRFAMETAEAAGGTLVLKWPGVSGRIYRIDRTTDLREAGGWQVLITNMVGVSTQMVCSIPLAAAERFTAYRLYIEDSESPASGYAASGAPPVFSTIGCIRLVLPSNTFVLASYPLRNVAGASTVSNVFGMQLADGSRLLKWNVSRQQFAGELWQSFPPFGEWTPGTTTLDLGEGFALWSPLATNVYLVGEVPAFEVNCQSIVNGTNCVAYPYPVAVPLTALSLGAQAHGGPDLELADTIRTGNTMADPPNPEAMADVYFMDEGLDWVKYPELDPATNVLLPGEAFWYTRVGTNDFVWSEVKPYAEPQGWGVRESLVVARPVITPAGGSFTVSVDVALNCATPGAAIRYTLDGSDPNSEATLYGGPFTLTESATVKARAFLAGRQDSPLASAVLTLASDVVAWHGIPGYRPAATNVVTCAVTVPEHRSLLALLWRPTLPSGWSLVDVSGDGAPQWNGHDIVFAAGDLTNNPIVFRYEVAVAADRSGPAEIRGEVEYTLNGTANPVTVPAAPDPLIAGQLHHLIVETAHGTATPSGTNAYLHGTVLTNTVTAPEPIGTTRFVCAGWAMPGHEPQSGSDATFAMTLTNDATLVWLWKTQYWLAATNGPGGTAIGAAGWLDAGSTGVVEAVADAGHHFVGWAGDVPAAKTNDNPLALTMDQARIVTAQFAPDPCTITASAGPGGTISPSGMVAVPYGGDATFAIAAVVNHHIADVMVDGLSMGATNAWTFTNVTNNHTIAATFAIDTCQLVVESAQGGAVPTGTNVYDYGTDVACGVGNSPVDRWTTQYVCRGWAGTGSVPIDGAGTNLWVHLTNDSTLVWRWQTQYWLTTTNGQGGRAIGAAGWLDAGSTGEVEAVADTGYHFVVWTGNVPAEKTNDNPLALTMDQARIVTAQFAPDACTITASAGPGGTIAPSGMVAVSYGSDASFMIAAAANHHVGDVVVDGVSVGVTNAWTFANITNDHTIAATFAIDMCQLVVESAQGGAVPAGTNVYDYGADVACGVGNSPVVGGTTQYVCHGWSGTGSVPIDGAGTNLSVHLTNDSTLVWQWETQYRFDAMAEAGGTVEASNGWRQAGAMAAATATAMPGFTFTEWTWAGGNSPQNPLELTLDRPYVVTARFAVNTALVQAVHACEGYRSPGTGAVIACTFAYPAGQTVAALTWRPELPVGWTLASGATNVVLAGPFLDNPIRFSYRVNVPGDQSVTNGIRGAAVFRFEGMTGERVVAALADPLLVERYHSADYRAPLWSIDGTEVNRVLAYWRAGQYHIDPVGYDGYASGSGDTGGGRHSADFQAEPWVVDATEAATALAYWRAGGYAVASGSPDGYMAVAGGQSGLVPAASALAAASQSGAAGYDPGGLVTVTNRFEYSGTLLTLVWRPVLPDGWTVVSVAGDGKPELRRGDLLWTGVLPPSPVHVTCVLRVPLSEVGPRVICGSAGYYVAGMTSLAEAVPTVLTLLPNDTDGDGLPDAWERHYADGDTALDPDEDADHDGMNNLQECLAGTDPRDATSRLQLRDATVESDGMVVLRWPSVTNRFYTVGGGADLVTGFSAIVSNLPATPPDNVFRDRSSARDAFFYRINVEP